MTTALGTRNKKKEEKKRKDCEYNSMECQKQWEKTDY